MGNTDSVQSNCDKGTCCAATTNAVSSVLKMQICYAGCYVLQSNFLFYHFLYSNFNFVQLKESIYCKLKYISYYSFAVFITPEYKYSEMFHIEYYENVLVLVLKTD